MGHTYHVSPLVLNLSYHLAGPIGCSEPARARTLGVKAKTPIVFTMCRPAASSKPFLSLTLDFARRVFRNAYDYNQLGNFFWTPMSYLCQNFMDGSDIPTGRDLLQFQVLIHGFHDACPARRNEAYRGHHHHLLSQHLRTILTVLHEQGNQAPGQTRSWTQFINASSKISPCVRALCCVPLESVRPLSKDPMPVSTSLNVTTARELRSQMSLPPRGFCFR